MLHLYQTNQNNQRLNIKKHRIEIKLEKKKGVQNIILRCFYFVN